MEESPTFQVTFFHIHIQSHVVRFTDDLTVSNGDEFDSSYKDIYPPELELKKTK